MSGRLRWSAASSGEQLGQLVPLIIGERWGGVDSASDVVLDFGDGVLTPCVNGGRRVSGASGVAFSAGDAGAQLGE